MSNRIETILAGAGLAALLLPLAGCSMAGPKITHPSRAYLDALEATRPDRAGPPSREAQEEAVARVIALFEDFSEDNLRLSLRSVYAEDLFFRDGFRQFTRIEPLEAYMIRSTEPLKSCTFEFAPPVFDGADVYLRWTMVVSLERSPSEVDRVIGMSHLRFDADGRVVFQQDYWDPTDVLYRRIPIANWLIGKVRARL